MVGDLWACSHYGFDNPSSDEFFELPYFNGPTEVEFTDDLIHNMMTKLSKTKEEVIKILNMSTSK
jgi:hypothetical protein